MKKDNFSNKIFKHPIVATDVVIFTIDEGKLKTLLIKMKKSPFENCWASPGGLVKTNESIDQAANRHLYEKTGLKNIFLEQLYTFGEVKRDPYGRVVSVTYFSLMPNKGLKLKTSQDYDGLEWFDVKDLPKLAYDHKNIIKMAVQRLQTKLEYTNVICNLLAKEFTMREIQKAYEVILDRELDKRNFQKKIHSLNIIKKTNKKTIGEAYRPAILYKFQDRKTKNIQIL